MRHIIIIDMFIVEAIAAFSPAIMGQPEDKDNQKQHEEEQIQDNGPTKRGRTQQQNQALEGVSDEDDHGPKEQGERQESQSKANQADKQDQQDKQPEQESAKIKYTCFDEGQKILVKETFENGWWLGHPMGKPELQGFFPSNYVKTGIKPPAPPAPKKESKEQEQPAFDPSEGVDWIKNELEQMNQIHTGPVKSDYYQGIKGYKMVKIDEKNQNILKGNHVQFDVATGLARVPVKDQAPAAKAVRQMGYYFDFHQWNEQRNHNPQKKARPDPSKKKAKKLHLKMMD